MDHHTTIREVGEGGVQAVCSCGWHSPVFGADKMTGTMDPLQGAAEETGFARDTVRKAVAVLVDEGRVYVVRGLGTFVSPKQ